MKWLKSERGQTLVELLVALGLSALMLPALATALVASREGRAQEPERLQATALLREADEAVRSVREKGWNAFAVNGTYHPTVTGSTWSLTAGAETTGNFTRQVVIADVQRNQSTGAIVASGGVVDPSTKRVTTTVSWTLPIPSSVSNETYYTRYLNNTTQTHTSQANFAAGTETNVTVTAGGDVVLSTGVGSIDWSNPSLVGSYNTAGNQDALDVFSAGNYVYLSDGSTLSIFDITTPTTPTLIGTYAAGATINHVFVSGNYAYLSTTSDTTEMIVVNITNPAAPTLAGTENLAGTADVRSIFVDGNYAYVARVSSTTTGSREFHIIDVTNPANPNPLGGLDLSGTVHNIKVAGNYAYLATTIDTQELLVINVTNKNTPTTAGSYNAAGTADANDLGIDPAATTIYLALATNASGAEVFSINVTTPATPSLLDTYEVGGTVTGASYMNNYLFLSTAISNRQLIVLDATSPSNLLLEANENLGSTANDVRAHGNYVYLATGSNSQELMVVGGTVVPGGYATSGTFESASIDAGATVGFNYLTFTITEPASTNIQFQIATNTNNTTWNYVGPDGTAATFFTTPEDIPLNAVSGRYLRYRASFTGPGTDTPTLSDVTVNYSP